MKSVAQNVFADLQFFIYKNRLFLRSMLGHADLDIYSYSHFPRLDTLALLVQRSCLSLHN